MGDPKYKSRPRLSAFLSPSSLRLSAFPRPSSQREQLGALTICVLLLVLATLAARFQHITPPNPERDKRSAWGWLTRPVATHRRLSLPGLHPFFPNISAIAGSGGRYLFTVDDGHEILYTKDGGLSWQKEDNRQNLDIAAVSFTDPQTGWAAGGSASGANIWHTRDGGQTWKPEQIPKQIKTLISIYFVTAQTGWAVGWNGEILNTTDGGGSWSPQDSHVTGSLYSVFFADPQTGWAVGDSGILHTKDGGMHWVLQNSANQHSFLFYWCSFLDTREGWVGDNNRTLLHTTNGGQNWKLETITGDRVPHAIVFVDPQAAWGIDENRNFLQSTDGGLSWIDPVYRRLFAPWYYAVFALLILSMFWISLPLPEPEEESIDAFAKADMPVERLEEDSLGYGHLVRRLSRFVQNRKTEPPLVFSVQGPWGTGKSSVMRMLQSKLKDDNAAATVWFNAWHHQNEDQLLAYLLEAIQSQAVPSWFTAIGISFRFNLLRIRLFASPPIFVLLLLITAFLGLVSLRGIDGTSDYLTKPTHASSTASEQQKTQETVASQGAVKPQEVQQQTSSVPETTIHPANSKHTSDRLSTDKTFAPAAGLIFLALVLAQLLSVFKADPQALLKQPVASVGRFLRNLLLLPSLIGKTNVRLEFAKNLSDAVEALRPQRLVIFLDDLDRCMPQQVVQILEAINFLSSAAPCFIVVGADYRKVETLVAMQFETVAQREMEDGNPAGRPSEQMRVVERVKYAQNYMRKIINLRLDLPRLVVDDYRAMLSNKIVHHRESKSRSQAVILAVVLLSTFAGLVNLYVAWYTPLKPAAIVETPRQKLVPPNSPQTAKGSGAEESGTPSSDKDQQGRSANSQTPSVSASLGSLAAPWWLLWFSIGMVGAASSVFFVIVLRRPKDWERSKDSQEFTEALEESAEAILYKCQTPREVRRFLNYLRIIVAGEEAGGSDEIPRGYLAKGMIAWTKFWGRRAGSSMPVRHDSRYDRAYVRLGAYGFEAATEHGIPPDAVMSFKKHCLQAGVPLDYFSVDKAVSAVTHEIGQGVQSVFVK